MAKLMLHRDILKGFGKLPSKVQKRVSELVERFQKDHMDPKIRLHPVKETMLDKKVRGADLPDGYRAIIIAPEKGDTFLLVHIDKHDEAYDWARNKRFEVHAGTGFFQVFDLSDVSEITPAQEETAVAAKADYPIALLTEKELFTAGVPAPLLPAVRSIDSDAALQALEGYLPKDCCDVLYGVAAGLSLDASIEEMLGLPPSEVSSQRPDSPGDFRMLDISPGYDLVLVDGEDSLRAALGASLEEWRIFLHPCQRRLVEWDVKGPMNVNGAAGTGKTVVLMHRAVHLARQKIPASPRILVTTFTTNLSITLRQLIHCLGPDVADCIEVTNLHALARTICSRSGWKGRIATEEETEQTWERVLEAPEHGELPLDKREVIQEYQQVIDANGLEKLDDYLTTVRSGRPRMTRKQRRALWPVFVAFRREMQKIGLMTFEGAIHEARLSVEAGNFQKYTHVLVDETQDFSLEGLRLIRALSPIEEGTRNPLCTVGDGHQRIYHAKVPMSRAGIDIRGRSRRLKVNYRTSEEIRCYAHARLLGDDIDDLDGGRASTTGDHSVFRGPEPEVVRCSSEEAEAIELVKWVKTMVKENKLGTHEVCITYSRKMNPHLASGLATAEMNVYQLRARQEDPGADEPGIRCGTMKRIKGLEFRAVAVSGCDDESLAVGTGSLDQRFRCERYVAATRAREHLLVTRKG